MQGEFKISVQCTSDSNTFGTFRNRISHPVDEVRRAYSLLYMSKTDTTVVSNSCDFVFAMKYIGQAMNLNVEFFLDGVSQGNDIEKIFESFNKAYALVDEICEMITSKKESESIDTFKIASNRVGIKQVREIPMYARDYEPETKPVHIGIIGAGDSSREIHNAIKNSNIGTVIVGLDDESEHRRDFMMSNTDRLNLGHAHIISSISWDEHAVQNMHHHVIKNHNDLIGAVDPAFDNYENEQIKIYNNKGKYNHIMPIISVKLTETVEEEPEQKAVKTKVFPKSRSEFHK